MRAREARLLRIAEMSFGLYLWHYVFVRSDIPLAVAAVATVAATIGSWYLIEQPVARWDAGRRTRIQSNRPIAVPTA